MDIPARACDCTFCKKHGGVWASCPTGELKVCIAEHDKVNRYSFGTKTADFLVCNTCWAVPVVLSEIEGTTYAVVNVNTFEGIEPALLRRMPASFDGEDQGTRLARRARGWIPKVTLVAVSDA